MLPQTAKNWNKIERTMTNEEKAKEICMNIVSPYTDFIYQNYKTAMTMAKWKDKQLEAEKQALIDKACEWWENELTYPTMTQADMFYKESMIKEFKQAMKGGEQ